MSAAFAVADAVDRFHDLYLRYAVPSTATHQIEGFTRRSMELVAHGQVRAEMTRLGYPDRQFTLPSSTREKLATEARTRAEAIVNGKNLRLQWALNQLPEGASKADADAALKAAWDGMRTYDQDTLIPGIADWTRSAARQQFHAENGIPSLWECAPGEAQCPICQEAVGMGQVSADQTTDLDMPIHSNCAHTWSEVSVDTDNLPDDLNWP